MPQAPGKHVRPAFSGAHRVRAPERRDAAHKRGYGKRWEAFRKTFIQSHPLCEYCLADGKVTQADVVDHDVPHRGDPDLFWDNTFTSLCSRHHNGEKARMEARLSGDALAAWVQSRKRLPGPPK